MARADSRSPGDLRLDAHHAALPMHAEGSVLIEVGDTRVICAASIEDRVPPFLRGQGKGWVTAEYGMLPRATTTRTQRESSAGKVGGRTQEIQRLIGRSLRSVVAMDKLGERTIWVDCDVIQADGGTRTASITGGFVALVLALGKLQAGRRHRRRPGPRLRRRHQRRRHRRRADARPRLRGGLARRSRHERDQDRRRPLHRGAGHRRGRAVRPRRARQPARSRRRRHHRAHRACSASTSARSSGADAAAASALTNRAGW